ncbi:PAS domain-containing protein [Terasakiella sp. SH-1]|uniref:PAS domain-containing protein n=1 Tax=Terasakiella sp. SH-1 TaxID=2560057 RepID=UPI0010735986|nr:PAS domain-containing protein [Terasakiella sp. SH-1]
MQLYGNPDLTGTERYFDKDEVIVSKTDTKGIITYANRTFGRLAGMTPQQAVGKNHNIIRHPHMPRCVFKLLWDTISQGHEIFAYVINRSLNGDHYWVLAHVTPSYNKAGEIVGYHSNRRVPNREVIDTAIIPLYSSLLEIEKSHESPKEGMMAGLNKAVEVIGGSGKEYNHFIMSLGG